MENLCECVIIEQCSHHADTEYISYDYELRGGRKNRGINGRNTAGRGWPHRFLRNFVSGPEAASGNDLARFCQEMNNCAQALIFPIS